MPKRATVLDAAIEKPLLGLHQAMDIAALWRSVQRLIEAAIPGSFLGLTLQHNPISPMIAKWTRQIPNGSFNSKPLENYFGVHPHSKFVRASDVFPIRNKLIKSDFYRQYMAPQKCLYAIGLFFWRGPRLICVIAIMRTAKQGDFTERQTSLLRRLYPQFQAVLRRLRLSEREHSSRMAFEGFLSRLPLPTILLRWNLQLAYQNQAARDFCELWEKGPAIAPLMKSSAPFPIEILGRCQAIKRQWKRSSRLNMPHPGVRQEILHHPKWPYLRATLSLKQISSAGVARPFFLVECEDLRRHTQALSEHSGTRLPHLARLTKREQQVTRLVCDGRSNQEIADDAGMSLATVKKHLYVIFRKLEVSSRSRLMALMQ
jgi:DNA-binding CsgD family transcriptional regulator